MHETFVTGELPRFQDDALLFTVREVPTESARWRYRATPTASPERWAAPAPALALALDLAFLNLI